MTRYETFSFLSSIAEGYIQHYIHFRGGGAYPLQKIRLNQNYFDVASMFIEQFVLKIFHSKIECIYIFFDVDSSYLNEFVSFLFETLLRVAWNIFVSL